ncbi:torsin-1A isoform X2 [Anabrus simplex]
MSSSEFDGLKLFPEGYTLNRSASFSDMSVRKRIVIEERVLPSPTGTTIFRQYSCEEVSRSPAKNKPAVCILRHSVSEVHIPKDSTENSNIKNLQIKSISNAPKLLALEDSKTKILNSETLKKSESKKVIDDNSVPHKSETRDIKDLSNSKSKLKIEGKKEIISESVLHSHTEMEVAKKVRHQTISLTAERNNNCLYFCLLLLFVCASLFVTIHVMYHRNCDINFSISEVEAVLNSKLFGQRTAVKDIVSALDSFFNSDKAELKLIVLAGTTGVGKSYAVSLLEEQFPWKNNIHHWVMPIDSEDMGLRSHYEYSFCGDNLVIIDNLLKDDISEAIQFARYLSVIAEQKRILALFVFSLPYPLLGDSKDSNVSADISVLGEKFHKAGINLTLISFQPLEKQHVISCIETALARSRYPYSKRRVDRIFEELIPHQDGCKRVFSKVSLHTEKKKTDL